MSLENLVEKEYSNLDVNEMREGWILTTAQYNAGLNNNYFNGLERVAKKYGYKIGILPVAGAPYEKDNILSERLQQHTVLDSTYKINDSLEINNWKVKPQKIKPLTGLRRFTKKNKSTIFGSPKQEFEHIPSNKPIPKLIATTGACTKPHYNMNTEIGQKAYLMHEYGALVVDVLDDTYFTWRSIKANNIGSFDDYIFGHWDGKKLNTPRKPFINLGDGHYEHVDEEVHKWTVDIIKKTKPIGVADHDIGGFSCISHHTVGNSTAQYFSRKDMTLDKEFSMIAKYMKDIYDALPKGSKYVVPQANHNEHLSRWIDEGRYLNDSVNINHVPELLRYRLNGLNPLEQYLKANYGLPKSIKFLTRNEDYKVYGIDFSKHGDIGASGSKFSINHGINNQGIVSKAHDHTGSKHEGVTSAGHRSQARHGYNKGESPWSYTLVLGYPNGNTQSINYIKKQ